MDAQFKAEYAKQEQAPKAYWSLMLRPATQKQFDFIKRLLGERDSSAVAERVDNDRAWATAGQFSTGDASALIDLLLAQPFKTAKEAVESSPTLPDVPAGRYAVDNEDGVLAFYVVDRPTEGKWAGRTFVSVQASDELHALKSFATKFAVLAKIAADPAKASRTYGQEIGSCGVCGRTLTDETSRANGIGPICSEKTGW